LIPRPERSAKAATDKPTAARAAAS